MPPLFPSSSPPPPTPNSTLSPTADPFYPSLGGRIKHHRWADDDSIEFDGDRPSTYLEAARRLMRPTTVSPMRA